nr:unnamed protein product [Callosobruchus analis]
MSKRQSTILGFIEKKPKLIEHSTPSSSCSEVKESTLSSTNEQESVIVSHPIERSPYATNIDVGLYITSENTSDFEKVNILKYAWKPSENFEFPHSVHKKITRRKAGQYKQTEIKKLVKTPLVKYSKLYGKDGDLVVHQNHHYHREAVESAQFFLNQYDRPEMKIENQLDSKRKQQIIENRRRLKPIIECIILLGRQNISFRGHRDDGITLRDEKSTEHLASGSAENEESSLVLASPINRGNFKAISEYRAIGDEVLREHLKNAGIRSTFQRLSKMNL